MLYRLFVILALAGVWFAYKEIGPSEIDPIGFVDRKVSEMASMDRVVNRRLAPAQCGPYFLYIHPESGTLSEYQYRKLFVVSRTPPDDRSSPTVSQIWMYGVRTDVLSRPKDYRVRGSHARKQIRPATYGEVWGDYIGDYACGPYKPNQIECDGRSPFCKSFD